MNELINMAQKELIPLQINDTTLPVDLIREIKGSIYVAKDHTYENMNQALWRGRFDHFGKIDASLDLFDRLDNAYFEIMKEAKLDKIDEKKNGRSCESPSSQNEMGGQPS